MTQDSKIVQLTPPAPGGNGTGGNDDRLRLVEQKLAAIEIEIKHLATKADIEAKLSSNLKWMVGTLITVGAAVCSILLFVLRNSS